MKQVLNFLPARKKILEFFFKIMLLCCSGFIAYKAAYFVAERFFFDNFFFNKSIKHGYLVDGWYSLVESSPRSDDILNIMDQAKRVEEGQSLKVLGTNSETYTVALIGDSYVWGQGLKTEDTFAAVLEKRLNKIRKTKVIRLGQSGDSVLDNYQKYSIAKDSYHVDLYIFLLVENDLVVNNDARYLTSEYNAIIKNCEDESGEKIAKFTDREDVQDDYGKLLSDSPKNLANLCVLEFVSTRLPQSNAIYLVGDDYWDNSHIYNTYKDYLKKNGLLVISLNETRDWPEYEKFWEDPYRYYPVSKLEPHPSKFMSNMYTDIIFRQLITNNQFKFSPNKD